MVAVSHIRSCSSHRPLLLTLALFLFSPRTRSFPVLSVLSPARVCPSCHSSRLPLLDTDTRTFSCRLQSLLQSLLSLFSFLFPGVFFSIFDSRRRQLQQEQSCSSCLLLDSLPSYCLFSLSCQGKLI